MTLAPAYRSTLCVHCPEDMVPPRPNRRHFLSLASGVAATNLLRAQGPSLAHKGVADLERTPVLARAREALIAPVTAITASAAPHAAANTFVSETQPDIRTAGAANAPVLFRAQARALREFSATVAALCAGSLLTGEPQYAARVAEQLRVALLAPATRLAPSFDQAGCAPGTSAGTPAGVVDLVPLAELARALSFVVDGPALSLDEWGGVRAWFKAASDWLNSNRVAGIARDSKDHRASAWLLLASAFARFLRDENALEACRKRFRSPTLRNQIRPDGVFPQEVATPNPYRNTLFNFDLLTGACQLLSSPFDPLWSYELIDGVGLRIVAAYLYPVIAHPERWGFVSDAVGFRDLPGRRPGMLFAGRAYDRPEYVAAWYDAPPAQPEESIAASFPIREPLLWTARAPHGF